MKLVLSKGRKPKGEGAVSPSGNYKKIGDKWKPIGKDKSKKAVPESFKAAIALNFINARNYGSVKEAKRAYAKIEEMMGKKGDQAKRYETLRASGLAIARIIVTHCPDSRERSLAVTKMREAIMWANAA